MSIKHALLGFLSWRPFTGYELKKMIAGSESLYWSGNNNQIYTTLVQIHQEGLVTNEVQQQEHYPARKVYTITEKGLAELRAFVLAAPDLPQLRNTFLIQLAWADQLSGAELDEMIANYIEEVDLRIRMLVEKGHRPAYMPARTGREVFLWEKITQNLIAMYQNELNWVRSMQKELHKKGF